MDFSLSDTSSVSTSLTVDKSISSSVSIDSSSSSALSISKFLDVAVDEEEDLSTTISDYDVHYYNKIGKFYEISFTQNDRIPTIDVIISKKG